MRIKKIAIGDILSVMELYPLVVKFIPESDVMLKSDVLESIIDNNIRIYKIFILKDKKCIVQKFYSVIL
jgi:hypothetical protein